MKPIAIDALLFSTSSNYRNAGVSGYITRLLHALAHYDALHHYLIFAASHECAALPVAATLQSQPVAWPVQQTLPRIAWERLRLPQASRNCALLHAPVNVLPPGLRCPAVVTVHDLAFLRVARVVTPLRQRYLAMAIRESVRRAQLVVAVSRQTRDDLIAIWGVPGDRIHVVAPAVAASLGRVTDPARLLAVRQQWDLKRPFFLFVGSIEPRKNLSTLIHAFAQARQQGLDTFDLVLAGALDWPGGTAAEDIRDLIRRLRLTECVHLPGYVPAAQLSTWYSLARALVMPSHYEGFGLPVAESLACGTPAIVSTAGSLPEVVGAAGCNCDPNDVAGWAAALVRMAQDDAWHSRLTLATGPQAALYSEQRLATQMMAVYAAAMR